MRIDYKATTSELKADREVKVNAIKVMVTRADGTVLTFDGDEESQKRLDRFSRGAVIVGMTEVPWKMADNSTVMVTPEEMIQAMVLAGQKQAELWFI